uniref:Uncharacterized protein n=1 Tax=Zea mays TaxID=4577 RepID=A0A804MXZ3_MAIZE
PGRIIQDRPTHTHTHNKEPSRLPRSADRWLDATGDGAWARRRQPPPTPAAAEVQRRRGRHRRGAGVEEEQAQEDPAARPRRGAAREAPDRGAEDGGIHAGVGAHAPRRRRRRVRPPTPDAPSATRAAPASAEARRGRRRALRLPFGALGPSVGVGGGGPHEAPVLQEEPVPAPSASNGERGPVADGGVVEPPNGAPFKPNVQQRRRRRGDCGGGGRRGQGGGRRGQTLALGVRGLEHDRLPDDGGGEGPSRSRRQDNERGRRRRRWLARRLCRRRPEQIRVQQSHHELLQPGLRLQLEREFSRLVIAGVGALQEQQGEGACPCLPHLERAACATREAASSCAPLDQTPGVGSLGRHAASSARERFGVVVRVGVAAVLQLHAGWSGSHRQTPDRDQGRRRL